MNGTPTTSPRLAAWQWQRAYWMRAAPRSYGLALMALVPAVSLLPLDGMQGAAGWVKGTAVLGWIGAALLAALLGRENGRPHASDVWLFQKGIPLTDRYAGRWMMDAALGTAMVAWWTLAWSLVAPRAAAGAVPWVALAIGASVLVAFLVSHAFLFLAGALGVDRGVELLVVFALASLLEPVLVATLPAAAAGAVHALLPPLYDAAQVRQALERGSAADALPLLVHAALFVLVCLGVGLHRISRWRPFR